jgi:hypothetical protein
MKGILKSFEVLITILFVLTAYFILFKGEKVPDLETATWKVRGFESLRVLDDSNKLASYALANETEKIEDELAENLGIGLDYKVLICNQTCPSLEIKSEKVTSVSYFIAGNASNVEPREVLLYMWRGT